MRKLAIALLPLALAGLAAGWSLSLQDEDEGEEPDCRFSLAQTVPEKLALPALPSGGQLEATHEALVGMLAAAQRTVRIASFYMELTPQQAELAEHPSARPGAQVREAIRAAGARGVDVEIVLDQSNRRSITNPADVDYLRPFARVKFLNMRPLVGGGILHTKFIVVDNATFYLGSANFDWRAYSHVKEVGLVARGCPVLARDLDKVYATYALMSERTSLPELGPLAGRLGTRINLEAPLVADGLRVLLAGSPPAFNGARNETGRAGDLAALLHTIRSARRHIDVSVMNYSPMLEFGEPKYYWPVIDDALREAATVRGVRVRLLFSRWPQSRPLESVWYRSLNALQSEALKGGSIHVRLYEVPAFDEWQRALPYARVKHDKYVVTDAGLYLGTSNWSPDYFVRTCGVGVVMEPAGEAGAPLVQTMREVFERDFHSAYAHELA